MIIRMTINPLLSKQFVCNLPPPPLSPPSPPPSLPPQPPSPPLHFQRIRYYRCHMINRNLQHFQFETILRLHPDTVGPHDTDIPNICGFFFCGGAISADLKVFTCSDCVHQLTESYVCLYSNTISYWVSLPAQPPNNVQYYSISRWFFLFRPLYTQNITGTK